VLLAEKSRSVHGGNSRKQEQKVVLRLTVNVSITSAIIEERAKIAKHTTQNRKDKDLRNVLLFVRWCYTTHTNYNPCYVHPRSFVPSSPPQLLSSA